MVEERERKREREREKNIMHYYIKCYKLNAKCKQDRKRERKREREGKINIFYQLYIYFSLFMYILCLIKINKKYLNILYSTCCCSC